MSETRIEYWYRNPRSSEEHHVRTETLDKGPEQALNLVHPVGTVFKLWSDHTERDGTQPMDRRIIEHLFNPEDPNTLFVIVTDPEVQ